ncbi:hypothetical protein [Bifidobacterium mongoliense]|uniref:hypothetical protein n=1 Tax=Bifidobacterium mongoliense TaxID=518643 RepID=UPI0026481F07|nr:hypothetical protein [Bifidobacterium mongoliense]MDN6025661.1 hypothetical protein [Bifidobacterium mongoliense]MDN6051646.1 hypothetical protein [Bifidobacterium mongoliense]MDN6719753.1 hypothetical protein [Bifidobacterium mongoliense]
MLAQILQPAPLDSWISPPLWWENFVPACVPMFLFLSGYFGLGRAMRDNDWSKSISNFWKNIWYWIRWVLLFSILSGARTGAVAHRAAVRRQIAGRQSAPSAA